MPDLQDNPLQDNPLQSNPLQSEAAASEAIDAALAGLQNAREQAENVVTKYPVATLVAAIAVGVALGCLIKRT